jgi:hypothetical protein
MKEKQEKPKKINRVRLGGGGPYVDKETFDEIHRRKEAEEISIGKVIDRAIAATKKD